MPCPLCASVARTFFVEHDGHTFFRCDACRLVYLDPPPVAHLSAVYDDYFQNAPTVYTQKAAAKLARARRVLVRIRRAFGRPAAGATFLDVGASAGFTAEAARETGLIATGIEPAPGAIGYARKNFSRNEYIDGFLETTDLGGRQFDIVHCAEVIEHSSDLQRFAAHLARAVKPGGMLYLTTPYLDHWRRVPNIATWDGFKPPEHCLFFDPKNLAQLLAQHGLQVFRQRFAWKPGIKIFARKAAS